MRSSRFLLSVLLAPGALAGQSGQAGEDLYQQSCARCHSDADNTRAPQFDALRAMSPGAILSSMDRGRMERHARSMDAAQRRILSEWLADKPLVPATMPADAFCGTLPAPATSANIISNGWGIDVTGSGYVGPEKAGLSADDVQHLELAWAFAFPNAREVRSKPAVVGNQLIITSQPGVVYSLDAETGCIHWTFDAEAEIRSSPVVGAGPEDTLTVFFTDSESNTYALNAETGNPLWESRAGQPPTPMNTGSPAYHDGVVYVPISSLEIVLAGNPDYPCCRSSGGVAALDASTGETIWYHRVIPEAPDSVGTRDNGSTIYAPSGAPIWASPTVDAHRGLLYVGTGENYTRPANATSDAVLAIRLQDGSLAWSYQATAEDAFNLACTSSRNRDNCPAPAGPDVDFGMSPVLTMTRDSVPVLVVGQKSGVVFGFNPDNGGTPVWSTRIGRGGMLGGIHWGLATDGQLAYVANADNNIAGSIGAQIEHPWSPGLYALDLGSGNVVWTFDAPDICGRKPFCRRANSAQPTVAGGVVFAGGLDGYIRAHSTSSGALLWEFDTAIEFETVNGVEGQGGALDSPGPVIANGYVYVNSGYGAFSQMSGNVLLAFRVGGR